MRRHMGLLIMILALSLAGCDTIGTQGGAAALLPSIPNTKVIEGKTITQYIISLSEGSSLLAGQPLLAAAIKAAEGTIACYQNIGAVALRVYNDLASPLSNGIIAVIDRKAIADPANLVHCLRGGGGPSVGAQSVTIQPCANTYTLTKNNTEFSIFYLATTKEMCEAICTRLEGCTASQK